MTLNPGPFVVAGLIILFVAVQGRASTIGAPVTANGYVFTNFDFPGSGTAAGAGTNINGISNSGAAVGFTIDNMGAFTSSVRNPNGTFTAVNAGLNAMAFGINSAGNIVGEENNAAFYLPLGGPAQTLATPAGATAAFGINDLGNIVGQYNLAGATPGFFVAGPAANTFIRINAPSGPNTVNAQGINNGGFLVGFYVGADGQDHGFKANVQNANNGVLTGTAIADPTIPIVPGEPGATFVFSQVLGLNDNGIAVGYYGDSTTSQHGFFYNTNTGVYTFLDDPSEQFNNGVEVTQITGINNTGEIAGFYSDAAGVFHGFVGCPVGVTCPPVAPAPEPSSFVLGSAGLALVALARFRRWRSAEA